LAGKRATEADFQGSAPDSEKIPGMLGMQNVLNGVSMAVGVMEMDLYSSYTPVSMKVPNNMTLQITSRVVIPNSAIIQ
jgi:hypothetical protein